MSPIEAVATQNKLGRRISRLAKMFGEARKADDTSAVRAKLREARLTALRAAAGLAYLLEEEPFPEEILERVEGER